MAWYQNPFIPWNWPSDLQQSFVGQLESGLEYILHIIIVSFLGIFGSVLGLIEDAVSGVISDLLDILVPLGPFALPAAVFVLITAFGGASALFMAAKNLPVVGVFA